MIVGIGIDLVNIARIKVAVKRRKTFIAKIFTPIEADYCVARPHPESHFAARFAAKEAFIKASGLQICWQGVFVRRAKSGQPTLGFSAKISEQLTQMGVTKTHLSLTHDRDYAIAQVILEGPTHSSRASSR